MIFGNTFVLLLFAILFGQNESVSANCASTWQRYGNFCYTIAPTTISRPNYNDSLYFCILVDGNLPTLKTQSDWDGFVSFAKSRGISGTSALGYLKYAATVKNHRPSFTSMYDGHSLGIKNWTPSTEPTSFAVMVVHYTSDYSLEAASWSTTSLEPICQQGLIYNKNTTHVPCASVYRCFQGYVGHRFSTDPNYCTSENYTIEQSGIGYALSIYIPLLTVTLFEMQEPVTGKTVLGLNNDGRQMALDLGYTKLLRVIYVLNRPFGNLTTMFHLIWQRPPSPLDSLLLPDNKEFRMLTYSTWTIVGTFHMFIHSPDAEGMCSLAQNCIWNEWQPWLSCNGTCAGEKFRFRTKRVNESRGGICDNIYRQTNGSRDTLSSLFTAPFLLLLIFALLSL